MAARPLSLEQYAVASAHIAHFDTESMSAVLRQLGVDAAAYKGAKDHWLEAIRGEFDDDLAPVASAYGATFMAAKIQLDRDKPRLDEVARLVERTAAEEAAQIDQTAPFGVRAIEDDALPFVDPSSERPGMDPFEVTMDQMGMTQPGGEMRPVPDVALPFAGGTSLSLTQFASLMAELAQNPAQREALAVRYGLRDGAALSRVETYWEARFVANPSERVEFDRLVATYTEWLVRNPS